MSMFFSVKAELRTLIEQGVDQGDHLDEDAELVLIGEYAAS